jgi:hypothetical protein
MLWQQMLRYEEMAALRGKFDFAASAARAKQAAIHFSAQIKTNGGCGGGFPVVVTRAAMLNSMP